MQELGMMEAPGENAANRTVQRFQLLKFIF